MVKVILINESIKDFEEFVKYFPWILPPFYSGQITDLEEKELIISPMEEGHFSTIDSNTNYFGRLKELEIENSYLKSELEKYLPKQNLRINESLAPLILELRKMGKSYQAIANLLNAKNWVNSRGNKFNAKLIERLAKSKS